MNKNIKLCYTTNKNQNKIKNIKSHENINSRISDSKHDNKTVNKKGYYGYF